MDADPRPYHVLVYDPDADILRIYGELLGEEGYHVTLVRGRRGGAAAVSAAQPDLVIVDPATDHDGRGSSFLAHLRAHTAPGHPPLLVCSGDTAMLAGLEEQLRSWGVAVVAKPFDIDDFLMTVRSSIDGSAASPRSVGDGKPAAA